MKKIMPFGVTVLFGLMYDTKTNRPYKGQNWAKNVRTEKIEETILFSIELLHLTQFINTKNITRVFKFTMKVFTKL